MLIKIYVALLDLVHVFLRADVQHVIVLSNHVDNSDFACLLGQLANAQSFILPPRRFKRRRVPG